MGVFPAPSQASGRGETQLLFAFDLIGTALKLKECFEKARPSGRGKVRTEESKRF